MYLNRFGGDPQTYEYAMLRVYENINKLNLLDIGYAMMNIQYLHDEKNKQKVFKKIENYIILTHEVLMKNKNL